MSLLTISKIDKEVPVLDRLFNLVHGNKLDQNYDQNRPILEKYLLLSQFSLGHMAS